MAEELVHGTTLALYNFLMANCKTLLSQLNNKMTSTRKLSERYSTLDFQTILIWQLKEKIS